MTDNMQLENEAGNRELNMFLCQLTS